MADIIQAILRTQKVEIPEFSGMHVDKWIDEFKKVCRQHQLPEDTWSSRAFLAFNGMAHLEAEATFPDGKATWIQMEKWLKDVFRPQGFLHSLREKLRALQCTTLELEDLYEYSANFGKLVKLGNFAEDEKMHLFVSGLQNGELRRYVRLQDNVKTWQRAYTEAKRFIEANFEVESTNRTESKVISNALANSRQEISGFGNRSNRGRGFQGHFGSKFNQNYGHVSNYRGMPVGQRGGNFRGGHRMVGTGTRQTRMVGTPVQCWICGQMGHTQRFCNKMDTSLLQKEYSENEQEVVYPTDLQE